jgi:hypothetical protein
MEAEPSLEQVQKLNELITEANQVGASAAAFSAQRLKVCIKIGRQLQQWKEQIPHGQWQSWIDDHVSNLNERTRQRWMRLAAVEKAGRLDLNSAHGLRHAYQLAGLLPESTGHSKSRPNDVTYLVHLSRLSTSLIQLDLNSMNRDQARDLISKFTPILDFLDKVKEIQDSQD